MQSLYLEGLRYCSLVVFVIYCWIYLPAIPDVRAVETDTFCGNVKGPYGLAQLGEAGGIGQGSPARRAQC